MNKNLKKKNLGNEKKNVYETDISAGVQNFPDGQKCRGLDHTNQGKISRSHSSELSWKRFSLQYVAASGQDESPTLAHRGPRQSPKNHLAKKNSQYDWEIKRKILNTSFKRSFGRNRESPQTSTHSIPSATFLHWKGNLLKGRQRRIKNNEQRMKV